MTKRVALIILLTSLLLLIPRVHAVAPAWQIDHGRSKLGFVAYYDNIPFNARFKTFSARIEFDPTDLKESLFDAKIDIRSVDSESVDRDEGMQEQAWFHTTQYPYATFTTTGFSQGPGPDQFRAAGRLTIKGVSREVTLPFTWSRLKADKPSAKLIGELSLKRTDYSIGTGEWATDGTIGFDVKVVLELHLIGIQMK